MDNVNTLILKWVKTPSHITAKVKGGIPGTEPDGILWSDCIQEVTPTQVEKKGRTEVASEEEVVRKRLDSLGY